MEAWVYEVSATGRHLSLGFIVVARRSAEISKMILSQAEIRIVHKLVDPTDLQYLRNWLTAEEVEKVRGFERGEAVVLGLEEPIWIKVLPRRCTHGGATPLTKPMVTPDLSEAIESLSELLKAPPPPVEAPTELLERLSKLEAERAELEEILREWERARKVRRK